jgi:hypothetical protein
VSLFTGLGVSVYRVTQKKFDEFTYMVSRKRGQTGALLGKASLNAARSAVVDLHKAQLVFYKDVLKEDATLIYDQVRSFVASVTLHTLLAYFALSLWG